MDQGRSDGFKRWFRKERLILQVLDHGAMYRHATPYRNMHGKMKVLVYYI